MKTKYRYKSLEILLFLIPIPLLILSTYLFFYSQRNSPRMSEPLIGDTMGLGVGIYIPIFTIFSYIGLIINAFIFKNLKKKVISGSLILLLFNLWYIYIWTIIL